MKQEDKDLLIKDLCSRLPYDQHCKYLCCLAKYRDDKQNVIFVKKENNND